MRKRWIILLIIVAIITTIAVAVKLVPIGYSIVTIVSFLGGVLVSYLVKKKDDVYKNG